jgi:DNA repair exonuclease SbcCD ATPase subunit
MADQARISNLDAIESFRSALIVFISKTRQSLETAQDAVKRTRGWLQLEQPAYWSSQIKLRQKKLDQAQQELMSARLSEFVDTPSMQQMAARKARAALEEAQAKLERTKTWSRDYDRTVDPLARKLDSFRDFIENDLAIANAYLVEIQKILDAYNETPPPVASSETANKP